MNAPLAHCAREYLAAGFFPIRVAANGKFPLDAGWPTARPTADEVESMFAQHQGNIGITFPSDLFAVDIDCKNGTDGRAMITALEFHHGPLPPTLTQSTPSGGEHRIFRLPAGVNLSNKVSIVPGIDIRTAGGQVVVEPSMIDGKPYRWIDRNACIADIPPVWLDMLIAKSATPQASATPSGDTRIPAGMRNPTLFQKAAAMGREGFSSDEINNALRALNVRCCNPPLDDSEIATIATSAGKYQANPEPWEVFGHALLPSGVLIDPPRRFKLKTAAEVVAQPPMKWSIRGVLPEQGLASVYGASGSGKTFLVMDMVLTLSAGRDWFGHRVARPLPVTYAALEGEAGISSRVKAHKERYGDSVEVVHYLLQSFNLLNAADVGALAESIVSVGGAGGVVVLDTLNRAAPGADENDSRNMGQIIAAAKELQTLVGGVVLLVHHTGKDASKGLRGHSSLHAALDAAIEVIREGDRRSWRIGKVKDDADGVSYDFRLDVVEVGIDEEGEPITSCVVVPAQNTGQALRRALPPKSGNQRIIWDALVDVLKASTHYGQAGAAPHRQCVQLADAIAKTRGRLVCESKRQTERTQGAITGLINRGLLEHRDGWIWMYGYDNLYAPAIG